MAASFGFAAGSDCHMVLSKKIIAALPTMKPKLILCLALVLCGGWFLVGGSHQRRGLAFYVRLMRHLAVNLIWLIIPLLFCCSLCGCADLEFKWSPSDGWSSSVHDSSDSSFMDQRTKYYEQRGQDPKTAHSNANYDFIQANDRPPNP
jgi:hypothetical protein